MKSSCRYLTPALALCLVGCLFPALAEHHERSPEGMEMTPEMQQAFAQLILGGRFLQTDYHGNFMSMPFQGLGIDDFDRVQGKHVAVWLDNMGTMIMTMEGKLDDSGKVLEMVYKRR